MFIRNMRHLYLPDPEGGKGNDGNDKSGDGGNGGTGGTGEGTQKGSEGAAGGSGTGGGGNDPGNTGQGTQNGNQGGNGQVPIDQLPQGWQDHIKELRGENKTRREAQADYDKYKAFYEGIQGVVSPESAKTPEQLKNDIETERAKSRESDLKLAIYQNAGAHGADPQALLDSASFLTDARKLDSFDGVGDLIKSAVEKNGRLKASDGKTRGNSQNSGSGPASSGSAPFQGGQGNGTQLTRDDLKSMSPEQIEKARQDGRLKTLLGG